MNRFLTNLLLVAAIGTAASCTREAVVCIGAQMEDIPSAADSTEYVTSFTASFSQDTKVIRNGEGKSEWEAGDEISIYYRNSDGYLTKVTARADNDGASTSFTLASPVPAGMTSGYLATYPSNGTVSHTEPPQDGQELIPSNVNVVFDSEEGIEASFENAAICAASTMTAGGNLEFGNICSILKFTTTNSKASRAEVYVGGQKCSRSIGGAGTYHLPVPKDASGITLRLYDSEGRTYPAFTSDKTTKVSRIYNLGILEDRVLGSTGSAGEQFRLMSFNILRGDLGGTGHLWSDRKTSCLTMLETDAPDLLGLQECNFTQRCDILNANPRYGAVGVAVNGLVFDYPSTSSNPIFYDSGKFLLERWGTFWLSSTPDTPGSYTFYYDKPRTATWAQFLLKGSTEHLVYICTHLQDNSSGSTYTAEEKKIYGPKNRSESVDLIVSRLSSINPSGYPMLLSADFNATCTASELSQLYSCFSLVADNAALTDKGNTYNGFSSPSGKSRIDHIFSSSCFHRLFAVERDPYAGQTYISDHWPVYTDFGTGIFSSSLENWTTDDISQ